MFCSFMLCAIRTARIKKLSTLVADVADHPADGNSIHVYVKHAEEDTEPQLLFASGRHGGNIGYLSICRRNHGVPAPAGIDAFRIAKKPEEKARQ